MTLRDDPPPPPPPPPVFQNPICDSESYSTQCMGMALLQHFLIYSRNGSVNITYVYIVGCEQLDRRLGHMTHIGQPNHPNSPLPSQKTTPI